METLTQSNDIKDLGDGKYQIIEPVIVDINDLISQSNDLQFKIDTENDNFSVIEKTHLKELNDLQSQKDTIDLKIIKLKSVKG